MEKWQKFIWEKYSNLTSTRFTSKVREKGNGTQNPLKQYLKLPKFGRRHESTDQEVHQIEEN